MTMMHVRGMLEEGLITEEEYRAIDTKMCEKYLPITGGTFCEISLLCAENRTNMVTGKEGAENA